MVETYTYDGETWYIAVMGSLGLGGGGYPQDGNILHPNGIGGDYKNIHTVAGEIFNLVDPENGDPEYSGIGNGSNLAFFAGAKTNDESDALIKIFANGKVEGLFSFSKEERNAGKWVDGASLYMKCVPTSGTVPSGATEIYRMEMTGYDFILYTKGAS
jgi:hypothetical protein